MQVVAAHTIDEHFDIRRDYNLGIDGDSCKFFRANGTARRADGAASGRSEVSELRRPFPRPCSLEP